MQFVFMDALADPLYSNLSNPGIPKPYKRAFGFEGGFFSELYALLKRARQVADGCVVAGVHYASDTEAGLALGDLLFAQLETQPRFQNDLTAAAIKDQIPQK